MGEPRSRGSNVQASFRGGSAHYFHFPQKKCRHFLLFSFKLSTLQLNAMSKIHSQPRHNLASVIVSLLREDIICGAFKPGEALAEPVLAKRFGVSRAPVREAMIELERAGLVQFKTTGRTHVRTLEEKDLDEIVEARIALEAMGARLAAMRWTEEDTVWVEKSIAEQEKAANPVEFSQLDIAMHEYIMERGGNGRLATLWQYIRWQFEMALTYIHHCQGDMTQDFRRFTLIGHWKVLETLATREPEAAAKVMAHHITGSLEWNVPEISKPSPPAVSLSCKSRSVKASVSSSMKSQTSSIRPSDAGRDRKTISRSPRGNQGK